MIHTINVLENRTCFHCGKEIAKWGQIVFQDTDKKWYHWKCWKKKELITGLDEKNKKK